MSTRVFTSSSPQVTRKIIHSHSYDLAIADIASTLPRLKQIDIEFMRRLHTKVNLIPVIAKADTLTDEEVAEFKERVRSPA